MEQIENLSPQQHLKYTFEFEKQNPAGKKLFLLMNVNCECCCRLMQSQQYQRTLLSCIFQTNMTDPERDFPMSQIFPSASEPLNLLSGPTSFLLPSHSSLFVPSSGQQQCTVNLPPLYHKSGSDSCFKLDFLDDLTISDCKKPSKPIDSALLVGLLSVRGGRLANAKCTLVSLFC